MSNKQYIVENNTLFFIIGDKRVAKAEVFAKAKAAAGPLWVEPISKPDPEKGSSIMMRFGQDAYPRGEEAATGVARRWVTLTTIYKELHDIGVEATLQDSRLQKPTGDLASSQYVPACALFVNEQTRAKNQGQAQTQTRMSDEDLLMQAMAVDEAKAMDIVGEATEFSMAQRARLRMLIASGTQAGQTKVETQTEPKTESVPTSAPPDPNSEALPF